MRTYIVTFEINNLTRKENVKRKLEEYESCCAIHENAWAIRSNKVDLEIVQDIEETINSGDRIFVMETNPNATWINTYGEEHTEWLVSNL